jgi:hypothetical protein
MKTRIPPRAPPATLATLFCCIALCVPAAAQLTTTPGPGGIPIAPGAPLGGYTPGGIGLGGVEIGPGRAARSVPMYREGPGGVPVLVHPDGSPDGRDSVVRRDPGCLGAQCLPQSLLLTISSRTAEEPKAPSPDKTIDSLEGLFAALRACWGPPTPEQAREGMQMSVRFSFRRTGDLMGPPFTTYTTPGTATEVRKLYREAIDATLERCQGLNFSKSFGRAVAGRPISVRFVDDRTIKSDAR